MRVIVTQDDLSDGAAADLLHKHLKEMHKYSPPESIHAIDIKNLQDPTITFWAARIDGTLAGCGALKELSSVADEIKSMKTDAKFLRQGIAAKILVEILAEAKRRAYRQVSLETGSNAAFDAAVAMYKKYGFEECGPFGDYKLDPYSRFFTKVLASDINKSVMF